MTTGTTNDPVVITVDGPSGAGKGTICRLIAQQLDYHLLDSGALYRLTALACIRVGIGLHNETEVAKKALGLDVVFDAQRDSVVILLEGEDATRAIREETVSMGASIVAAQPDVRAALLQRQREFAKPPGLVADGRDMGTIVFPEAPVKIFLTASADERAKRRYLQIQEAGNAADYQEILTDIRARDERDSNRAVAPLKPADDALVVDSTALTIEEVVDAVFTHVRAAGISVASR